MSYVKKVCSRLEKQFNSGVIMASFALAFLLLAGSVGGSSVCRAAFSIWVFASFGGQVLFFVRYKEFDKPTLVDYYDTFLDGSRFPVAIETLIYIFLFGVSFIYDWYLTSLICLLSCGFNLILRRRAKIYGAQNATNN